MTRRIGYWNENGVGQPQDYVKPASPQVRRLIINHLTVGMYAEGWLGYAGCRICGEQLGTMCLTDGTYQWPEKYEHYINGHRPELIRVGFWAEEGWSTNMAPGSEIPDRHTHWPWPADAQGELPAKYATQYGAYLARGEDIDLHYDGTWEACRLGGEDGCPGEPMPGWNSGRFKTDGVYVWPADYAHYVLVHQVAMPPVFSRHVHDQTRSSSPGT